MPEWFYQDGEEAVGPFKASDLLQLVRDRSITSETLVRKDASAWFPAGQVGGLFEAASRPTVQFFCPQCDGEVGKPPCYCRRCRRLLDYARPRFTEHQIEGYEKPEKDKETLSGSWKQWVRRLKLQRQDDLFDPPASP